MSTKTIRITVPSDMTIGELQRRLNGCRLRPITVIHHGEREDRLLLVRTRPVFSLPGMPGPEAA